jgi:hypothetical protein
MDNAFIVQKACQQAFEGKSTSTSITTVLSGQVSNLGTGVHETRHHRGAGFYDVRLGTQGCIGAAEQDVEIALQFVPLFVAVLGCEKAFIAV